MLFDQRVQDSRHRVLPARQILREAYALETSWESNQYASQPAPHLFQALFTEGALGRVVQAALQTVFAEGVATWCRHRLVEQPAVIAEMKQSFWGLAH